MPQTTTVRLEDEIAAGIDFIAEATKRSKSFVLQEALAQYVHREKSVIDDIRLGLDAVNSGHTIPHSEVKKRLRSKGFNV